MNYIKKNYKKIIGYIITITSIVFVIRMLLNFDIDYSDLLNFKSIALILLFSLVYGVIVWIAGYPWKKFLLIFTGKNIPYCEICIVWSKSNILKYIPGNVFQYLGRNQIAIKYRLDHFLVGSCTVLEVLFNLIGTFVIGIVLYFPGLQIYWEKYFKTFLLNYWYIIVVLIIIMCIVIFSAFKFSKRYKETIKNIFKPKNFSVYIGSIIYFSFISTVTAVIYISILRFMLQMNITTENLLIIAGAFLLSWIVGFITPGAPGGIGVRELALSLILEPILNIESIVLGIIIYRIINILGDFVGVGYSIAYNKIRGGAK